MSQLTTNQIREMALKKQDITQLDVSHITNMNGLFSDMHLFNQDISQWNVSNVTDMSKMFCLCDSFNQDLSKWNVSNVADMSEMFCLCDSFNQDLSKWNVSNVTDMSEMFLYCESFFQDLSNWQLNIGVKTNFMFQNSKLEEVFGSMESEELIKKSYLVSYILGEKTCIGQSDLVEYEYLKYLNRK